MADLSFGSTVGMLENAMSGASLAHGAIANNIANVNTPNFRRSDVSFKAALAAAEPQASAGDELQLTVTSDRHIGGVAVDPQPFKPEVKVDETTQMRNDQSNVDVDQEMAKLSQNSAYAQTMSQLLGVQFTRLRQVIQEHV